MHRSLTRFSFLPLLGLFLTLNLGPPPAAAQAIERGLLERINATVFEVVALKPTEDSLSYERPLPLELLPYLERTDKYRSFGTAFAISPTEFITAAHVLALGGASVYRDYFIRDVAGNVFPIDRIVKFSSRRDFAVFTVQNRPPGESLPVNSTPELNGKVFAVGNALGEGIVIRDGLYTSTTPEEIGGEWKWQRFSAAASPGNSGGPLLDEQGRVIGVIERKSPNENLNVALPIDEVLKAPAGVAHLYARGVYFLDNMPQTKVDTLDRTLPLPRPLPELRSELTALQNRFSEQLLAGLIATEKPRLFPNGRESLPLLYKSYAAAFPALIVQGNDGNWDAPPIKETRTVELENNGALTLGRGGNSLVIQLRKPDDVPLASLLRDSKLFIDTVQKVLGVKRQVGMDKVRITSFGPSRTSKVHVDSYGRKWLLNHWLLEYNDEAIVTLSLPVPGGSVSMLRWGSTADMHDHILDLKALTDFMYVTFDGSLAQWREYLALPDLLPELFGGLHIDFEPAAGFSFRSPRLALSVPTTTLPLTAESGLQLRFGFFREGTRTAWDVRELVLAPDRHGAGRVSVVRAAQPPPELGDKYRSEWEKIAGGRLPYNRAVFSEGNTSVIAAARPAPLPAGSSAPPALYYTVSCIEEGSFGQERMERLLDDVLARLQILEPGGAGSGKP